MDPKGACSSSNPQVIHAFAHPIHSVPHPAGERESGWEEAQQLVETIPAHFPIPGSVFGQIGWRLEQPRIVESVPAHGSGLQ